MRYRSGRSSKYKPLTTKSKRTTHKVREQKLPEINPSSREIWTISKGNITYQRNGKNVVIADLDEEEDGKDILNMENILLDLIQEDDYSFEEIVRFMCFLPSLLVMCKSRNIQVINIPSIPTLEDYKKWKEEHPY